MLCRQWMAIYVNKNVHYGEWIRCRKREIGAKVSWRTDRKRDRDCLYRIPERMVEIDRNRNVIYDFAVWTLTNCNASLVTMWNVSMDYSAVIACRQNRDCRCVIPIHPPCPVNTGSQSTSTTMVIMENISTLLDEHLLDNLNITWTNIVANGVIIVNSCRVLRVDSVDIIVLPFVLLEVEMLVWLILYAILIETLDWTTLLFMNLYVVSCSIVRWRKWNKWLKRI